MPIKTGGPQEKIPSREKGREKENSQEESL
jgi:hypothetical protein